jgi:hypothetical protein
MKLQKLISNLKLTIEECKGLIKHYEAQVAEYSKNRSNYGTYEMIDCQLMIINLNMKIKILTNIIEYISDQTENNYDEPDYII